jgi:hypothetical protein
VRLPLLSSGLRDFGGRLGLAHVSIGDGYGHRSGESQDEEKDAHDDLMMTLMLVVWNSTASNICCLYLKKTFRMRRNSTRAEITELCLLRSCW